MLRSSHVFSAAALPYDLLTRHPIWERHCAAMAAELPAGARRVLDLGCGPGNSTAHLHDAVGAGAIGLDYSRAMLECAHRRDGRLSLVCGDGTRLPIRSGSLDAVTFHSVLYLLPDQAAALAEVARCLRPGGRAVLLEPRAGSRATALGLLRALQTPRWALTAACWRAMSSAYGRYTPDSLSARLAAASLRMLKLDEALGGLALLAVAERPAAAECPAVAARAAP
jgi:ubiquinone/menaquinone biosynthesis C-methylase UbiE